MTFTLRKINPWDPPSWLVGGHLSPSTRAHTEAAYWGASSNLCFHKLDKAVHPPLKTGHRRGLDSSVVAFGVKQVLQNWDKSINKTTFLRGSCQKWTQFSCNEGDYSPGHFWQMWFTVELWFPLGARMVFFHCDSFSGDYCCHSHQVN